MWEIVLLVLAASNVGTLIDQALDRRLRRVRAKLADLRRDPRSSHPRHTVHVDKLPPDLVERLMIVRPTGRAFMVVDFEAKPDA